MFFSRVILLAVAAVASVSAAPAPKVESRDSIHSGHATWYSAGVSEGNCGWWSTNADHIVALNAPQYGSTDKVSEHCGRLIRITNKNNKKVVHAVIADSCPECKWGSLDLSKGLFSALTDGNLDEGVFPIEWSYIN
ncbi:hypothetical protein MBRA1_003463 [Malassezia brasiliensis]|uniref:RlpA-like protein double-psi beta-barrel domain-containing protein n=1 Tax=Malassezia brasiliensis TaxID=1821822 RepID=A0AAF0DUX5_9BASI|nr:hypothetical protein MBRA1_003463 [Malassezia brasiliensis]